MLMRICPDCGQTSETWEVICNYCGFPELQSEGIEVEINGTSGKKRSSHNSNLKKIEKTSAPPSTENNLTLIKNYRFIILGLTLALAVSTYLYFSSSLLEISTPPDNSQLVSQEVLGKEAESSPLTSENTRVFEEQLSEETNVEKAIRVTRENQHHFKISDDMTMIAFFEDRQRENAKTDPTITISGFKWVGESLLDNPNKVKVEYQSYPTIVTSRWYWLVDLSSEQISIMDSNQDGYAFKTLNFTSENSTHSNSRTSNEKTSSYWYQKINLNRSHLKGKSAWELLVMRNEVVARHGRTFNYKPLQDHFNSQAWYKINPNYSSNLLTPIEKNNMETILQYEKEMGYM